MQFTAGKCLSYPCRTPESATWNLGVEVRKGNEGRKWAHLPQGVEHGSVFLTMANAECHGVTKALDMPRRG